MGTVDVDAMRHSMTPEQMDGWMAFDELCPIGGWHRAAVTCASIVNAMQLLGGAGQADEVLQLDQFLPACLRSNDR